MINHKDYIINDFFFYFDTTLYILISIKLSNDNYPQLDLHILIADLFTHQML